MDAFIFDIDGVVVDSEQRHFEVLRTLFPEHTQGVAVEQLIGLSLADTLRRLNIEGAGEAALHDRISDHYCAQLNASDLRPGISQLIDYLEQHGVPYGFVSTAPRKVCQANLALLLRGSGKPHKLISGDDVVLTKPHPHPYQAMLACLAARPTHCWVLEDTALGIAAARSAGIAHVIAWPHALSGQQDYRNAEDVIVSLDELYSRWLTEPPLCSSSAVEALNDDG
ncbi:Phosphoglycolate phosphatase [Carnimonas sp. R-84981]|uniref:HAD family hydrolase n=1 Tax=Carnimonas bestiolae TaxID=3402172 RepID=UPI003EDBACAE